MRGIAYRKAAEGKYSAPPINFPDSSTWINPYTFCLKDARNSFFYTTTFGFITAAITCQCNVLQNKGQYTFCHNFSGKRRHKGFFCRINSCSSLLQKTFAKRAIISLMFIKYNEGKVKHTHFSANSKFCDMSCKRIGRYKYKLFSPEYNHLP